MPVIAQYILLGLWATSFGVYAWTEGKDHSTMIEACLVALVSPIVYVWRFVCACFQILGEILVGIASSLD
tara:strand:- start:972 stop:1181 length:210 start_codon:yes stop_codon:yes gene_type:complete